MNVPQASISGAQRGHQTAQRELYDSLLPYLNALCGRYLNDTSVRQDILQEAFIVIFEKIGQFDPQRGAFHSWASRIVINACLKYNRRGRRFFHVPIEEHEESVAPVVLSQFSNADLVRFLKTMPEKYYQVFNLHVVDGFSHEEVAELLGIKVSLSRKRLERARAWLQTKPKSLHILLGEHGFEFANT